MPVQTTSVRAVLGGNGGATVFPFSFHCSDAGSISVTYTDANGNSLIVPPSAYAVTLSGDADGGAVTYAPAGGPIGPGTTLAISRAVPLTQLVDIANQGGFYPKVVIGEFDQLAMADQQLADQIGRSISGPVSDTPGLPMTLPSAGARANQALGFDSYGRPTIYALANVPGVMSATNVLVTASAPGARPTTVAAKLNDWLDLKADFGGVGDGSVDDTSSVLAWLEAVILTGRQGHAPAGRYRVTSSIGLDVAPCARTGFRVQGAGGQQTTFDFTGVNPALSPFTLYCSSGASFYHEISDLAIRGTSNYAVVALGRQPSGNAYRDELNDSRFDGLVVNNLSTAPTSVALGLYGVYNCDFFAVANSGGHGVALDCAEVQFSTFRGSYSSADVGVDLSGFYSYGNVFLGVDLEVVNTCVRIGSSNASRNLFIGGQFVWSNGSGPPVAAIDATAGNTNRFMGANFGSPGSITAGSVGVLIDGSRVGDTQVGNLYGNSITLNPSAGDADIVLDAPDGASRFAVLKHAGSTRWQLGATNGAETGGQAGTDLQFERFDDAGNLIDSPLSISRATGDVALASAAIGRVGFFGAGIAAGRPAVTGSRASGAATASLLNALTSLGLITDSTVA